MKLTLQTQLFPDAEQARQLQATVERFNEAANWLAEKAFERRSANKVLLQKLHYADLRERFGLSAQMAVRCIAQVCEAYSRDKSIQPTFRPQAAMPFDQRMMSFKGVDRVSLLTLEGRVIISVVMGAYQRERFTLAKGQSDLVQRKDGKWFLLVTVEFPDGAQLPVTDFIGVDLGVNTLAATSDGDAHTGADVEHCRQRYHGQRQALQKAAAKRKRKGIRPKNVRRKLKKIAKRERRFRSHTNHVISKRLVAQAKDSGRGIGLEDLQGIRDRIRFRKPQRAKLTGWAFSELRRFIKYKAQLAGVPIMIVDSTYTSQECSCCHHIEKANRRSQADFQCRVCAFEHHADLNAALNIRARAVVMQPQVSEPQQIALRLVV